MLHRSGRWPIAAFGEIGVVHQEHVAGLHGLGRKIAHHGIRHRRIGAPGQLAAVAVEQADAVVMGFADHRAARGALDGVFDFRLDRIERAFDDLQHDRVDRAACAAARSATDAARMHVHRAISCADRPAGRPECRAGRPRHIWPGNTTVVEPNSSTTAGPSTRHAGGSDARS